MAGCRECIWPAHGLVRWDLKFDCWRNNASMRLVTSQVGDSENNQKEKEWSIFCIFGRNNWQCMVFSIWLANTTLDRKRVKDACKASNLSKEEKTLLVLCKVLWRKEADEEISLTLQGHTGIFKYNYPAAAADSGIKWKELRLEIETYDHLHRVTAMVSMSCAPPRQICWNPNPLHKGDSIRASLVAPQ